MTGFEVIYYIKFYSSIFLKLFDDSVPILAGRQSFLLLFLQLVISAWHWLF